jgi:hypothetical protein
MKGMRQGSFFSFKFCSFKFRKNVQSRPPFERTLLFDRNKFWKNNRRIWKECYLIKQPIPSCTGVQFMLYKIIGRKYLPNYSANNCWLVLTINEKCQSSDLIVSYKIQWKPLNVITLGQRQTDNTNCMLKISKWKDTYFR